MTALMVEETDFVPDALLGVAKDGRYIKNLTSLISETLSPYFISTGTSNNSGSTEAVSKMLPEISLVARALHAFIFIKDGRSLGLDYLGLGYAQYPLRIRVFALLYTISPYIIERVGQNGWGNLYNIQSSLLFLRNRNRMHTTVEREQLRGPDRRRAFEEMRLRMIERASGNSNNEYSAMQDNGGNNGNINGQLIETDERVNRQYARKEIAVRIRLILQKILRKMSVASKIKSPIPHEESITSSTSDGNQETNRIDTHRLDRLTGLFKWLIRLNLALFYANGKYPSILHRLTGLKMKRDNMEINIVAERPAYNSIGLMVIGQCFAKLMQAMVEISVDAWYARKKKLNDLSQSDKIEAKVPSNESSRNDNSMLINDSSNTATCGICMKERNISASPIGCGHVFCWNCIQHWIATVRPECPFCRAPARSQDIIVLHNYLP